MAKITFDMPRGDAEFDELEKGEKMTVSCTIRKDGPDKGCLVSVNGHTLEGYDDDDSEDEESEEEDGEEEVAEEGDMMDAIDEQLA